MKVIVWVKVGRLIYDIKVRKCPPNYITKESEYIIELDDYTEEDIKEYFPTQDIQDLPEEQYISLMHE
jgi:hypothetical protein